MAGRNRLSTREKLPYGPILNLDVNEDIIAGSIEKSGTHCMLAEAVKAAAARKGIKAVKVAVDIQTIRFSDPDVSLRYIYLTPRTAQEAIVRFDMGVAPEPFKLQLRGAHVIKMDLKSRERQAKLRASKAEALTGDQKIERALAGLRNVVRGRSTSADGSIPVRVGGRAPPKAGMRREFGLRGFDRSVTKDG